MHHHWGNWSMCRAQKLAWARVGTLGMSICCCCCLLVLRGAGSLPIRLSGLGFAYACAQRLKRRFGASMGHMHCGVGAVNGCLPITDPEVCRTRRRRQLLLRRPKTRPQSRAQSLVSPKQLWGPQKLTPQRQRLSLQRALQRGPNRLLHLAQQLCLHLRCQMSLQRVQQDRRTELLPQTLLP